MICTKCTRVRFFVCNRVHVLAAAQGQYLCQPSGAVVVVAGQDPPQWGLNGPCTDTRQPRGNDTRQAPAAPDVTPKRVPRSVIKAKRKHMHKCKDGSIVNTSELSKKHDLSSFFIDAEHGLLYRVNADDSDTLCVPAVTAANNESIRYHIYMEMHDSPFYGHRGVSGTYNAIQYTFSPTLY